MKQRFVSFWNKAFKYKVRSSLSTDERENAYSWRAQFGDVTRLDVADMGSVIESAFLAMIIAVQTNANCCQHMRRQHVLSRGSPDIVANNSGPGSNAYDNVTLRLAAGQLPSIWAPRQTIDSMTVPQVSYPYSASTPELAIQGQSRNVNVHLGVLGDTSFDTRIKVMGEKIQADYHLLTTRQFDVVRMAGGILVHNRRNSFSVDYQVDRPHSSTAQEVIRCAARMQNKISTFFVSQSDPALPINKRTLWFGAEATAYISQHRMTFSICYSRQSDPGPVNSVVCRVLIRL